MKILITGSKGFIGKNLIAELSKKDYQLCEFDIDSDIELLDEYTKDCDFVVHLAGINRPKNVDEFMVGNYGFTSTLLARLKRNGNRCPILVTSSIQASLDNPYGNSKRKAEDELFEYGKKENVDVLIYRMPNVFGKWCMPNYNSAVSTFCYNIAHDLEIKVNDENTVLRLVYIDDVIKEIEKAIKGKANKGEVYCFMKPIYETSLGNIVKLLYSFRDSRELRNIPDMSNEFTKKLYSTYLSYLPNDRFSYELKMNVDNRGSFTEMLKSISQGQVSINISKPHIVKGNHWHHTKCEKFLVVSGKGVIRFRKINTNEIIEYFVSGDKLEVVDIPVGYTHNIENIGEGDMVTVMWCNEPFDPNNPDTYYLEV